jgi:hypothetical protein
MNSNTLCPMIDPIERREHKGAHVHTRDSIFEWVADGLRPEQAYEKYVESRVWERDGKSKPNAIVSFKAKYTKAKKDGPPATWSICGKPAGYVIRGTSLCVAHVKQAVTEYDSPPKMTQLWNVALLYDMDHLAGRLSDIMDGKQ